MNTVNAITLFDFRNPAAARAWFVLDDVVMGGVSQGRIQHISRADGESAMRFSGVVRLENNGGFSSIRAQFRPIDLSKYTGVVLRLRGDGKRYGFNLQNRYGPLSYQAEFEALSPSAQAEWQDVLIPFAALRPVWYGETVQAAPFDRANIASMNIIIADKQKGPFAIEIAAIGVYPREDDSI